MSVHRSALDYMSDGFENLKITDDRVLNFIELLKGVDDSSREVMEEMFTKGDCGRFHFILHTVFPEAVPYAIMNGRYIVHVITLIDGKFYDIKGIFNKDRMKDFDDIEELVGKKLEDTIKEVDREHLTNEDMFCNYCFEVRGPIL
jgi:hypothetical protein